MSIVGAAGDEQIGQLMNPPRNLRATLLAASLAAPGAAVADPVAIAVQPAGQTVRPGQHAGFAVVAPGATSYQWYVSAPNGAGGTGAPTAVPNGTGPFLLTAPITGADAGTLYTVAVGGPGGTTLSVPASVTLTKDPTGAPPAGFWGNTAGLPAATQSLTLNIINRTFGFATNAQVYWSVSGRTASGQQVNEMHSLADKSTYDLPPLNSARMYVYLARGSAEVGTGAKDFYDFIEFNIGRSSSDLPYNFNGDTTRVDAFGLKLAFRLQCADGTLVTRGEDYGTFLERRAITFQKYAAELGQPFAAASTTFAPYRIAEPGTSGFGAGGPYANYEKAYVDAVYANNGIDPAVVAKPTPFINLSAQLPDLSAAIERHVAETPGTFKSDGTLVDPDFWRKTDRRRFYAAVPANMYARYWHKHAIGGYQYGFPYDDVGGYSSDVSCNGPQSLVVAVGW